MSKTIASPVKRWPGTVALADPLTYPQLIAYQLALVESQQFVGVKGKRSEYYGALLRGICGCVEEWKLSGRGWPDAPSANSIPSTPQAASEKLIDWLLTEVAALVYEADTGPNE